MGLRLHKIREKVKDLIDQNNIESLIIEDIQLQANVGNNVQTFKVLAEVFGVINELAFDLNIPFDAVPPTVWRSDLHIGGRKRAEQKKNAQLYVLENYNKKVSEDESDAICIGAYKTLNKNINNWAD